MMKFLRRLFAAAAPESNTEQLSGGRHGRGAIVENREPPIPDIIQVASARKTLALLGGQICKSPEEYKAWSQNLSHENVLTTFSSYGDVASHRQAEIIRALENWKLCGLK
jgi:hypothetical protein